MNRAVGRSVLPVIAAVVLWLVAAVASLANEDAEIAARLDALADAVMMTDQVPGAIAAVVSGDMVILRGYGLADIGAGTPADPDATLFEIGSITKLFTWVALMILVVARRWPGSSRRYETSTQRPDNDGSAPPAAGASAVSDWDSLSAGDDPTGTPDAR